MKKLLLSLFILLTIQVQAQCWKEVAAGFNHTIAIKTDGTLWGWGDNSHGQIGITGPLPIQNIYQISTDTNWKMVSAGMFGNIAIKNDGTLWGWGANYSGEIGTGDTTNVPVPTQIGTDTNWIYVSLRAEYTAAIKADGTLWTWGNNNYLQLGHSLAQNFYAPTQMGTDTDWKMASVSLYATFGIKTNGTLWAWGTNGSGIFGNGAPPSVGEEGYSSFNPVQIGSDTDWDFVSPGASHVAAIKSNGTLWTWGSNEKGILGNGLTTDSYFPAQVGTATWKSVLSSLLSDHSFCAAINTENVLYTWGANQVGQLANGTIVPVNIPMRVNNDTDWKSIMLSSSSGFAIKNDDSLYSWGSDAQGQLGYGKYGPTPNVFPGLVNCNVLLAINKYEALLPITIYPNPTTNNLHIVNPKNTDIEKIIIFDTTGKKLFTTNNNTQIIDVQNLTDGVYYLNIVCQEGSRYISFIKN